MTGSLSELVNLYIFTTGRRLFALRGVLARTEKVFPELTEPLRLAIRHGEHTMEMESMWGRRPSAGNLEALAIDNRIDQVIAGFHSAVCAIATAAPPDSALARCAARLRDDVFEGGIQDLIQLTHPEEVEAVDQLLRKIGDGYREDVKTLALSPVVDEIGQLNRQFRASLAAKTAELTFDQVRASQAKAQEQLLGIVAMVIGRFPGFRPGDAEKRDELLAPVIAQNEAIAAYRRSRRPVQDVNPSTGEVKPGTAEGAQPVEQPAATGEQPK